MSSLLESLKKDLLLALINIGIIRQRMNRDKLYETAKSFLGQDASPLDIAKDDVSCMESISNIIRKALPELNFPFLLSTRAGYAHLIKSFSFREIDEPDYGDIVVYVTGMGNGNVSNGHIGCVGKNLASDGTRYVMSNNSFSGKFTADLTLGKMKRYYQDYGGMEPHYFSITT